MLISGNEYIFTNNGIPIAVSVPLLHKPGIRTFVEIIETNHIFALFFSGLLKEKMPPQNLVASFKILFSIKRFYFQL